MSSGIRTYSNETQGTIDYTTGQITLNSFNVASISNIRGATSTVIELTVTPDSNDVVPVRDQIIEIDVSNSNMTVTLDTFVGGSADRGKATQQHQVINEQWQNLMIKFQRYLMLNFQNL